MGFFKIIRPVNLLLIGLTQFLIKYTLFEQVNIPLALDDFQFALVVLATVFIAAGGNIINDIYDLAIDRINKPKKVYIGKSISETAAYNSYIIITSLGVLLGFYVANSIGKPGLAGMFVICAALLYFYASFLKSMLILGNILIAVLVGLSLLILVLFDIYPMLDELNRSQQIHYAKVVWYYAVAAFYLNLMREWVKDIQDVNGDKNGGRTTLPILLGNHRTTMLVFGFGVFAFFMLVLYAYYELYTSTYVLMYFLFALGGPLLLFCIKAWNAEKQKEYAFLSSLLKIIFLLGVCSIPFMKNLY